MEGETGPGREEETGGGGQAQGGHGRGGVK